MDATELAVWQGRPVEAWRSAWRLPALRVFHTVGSTNDLARTMAAAGAAEGSLVVAEEQTAGRGRLGRRWSSPAGASLSLSMVLRPGDVAHWTPALTLRLGLAAAEAIETVLPVDIAIKWPNDLVALPGKPATRRGAGRKLAGILCEGDILGDRINHVIAGIGVNLAQHDDDWPPELAGRATSLAAAAGAKPDVPRLVGGLAEGWIRVAASAGAELDPDELDRLQRRDRLRDRDVRVDGRPVGTAAGISPRGGLLVRSGGELREIIAGTVRLEHDELGGPT
ncbi:MAG: biotin--[acetyl-CoA-carboxylase] ligase [Gemmatimonadota bacterium]